MLRDVFSSTTHNPGTVQDAQDLSPRPLPRQLILVLYTHRSPDQAFVFMTLSFDFEIHTVVSRLGEDPLPTHSKSIAIRTHLHLLRTL